MMCGQLFSLLILLLLIFPLFIYAKQCPVGGRCKSSKNSGEYMANSDKECVACIVFNCSTGDGYHSVGTGCYDDFDNVCKWVPTDVKRSIFNSMNTINFTYIQHESLVLGVFDSDIAFKSAVTLMLSPRGIGKSCIYDDAPKPKLNQVNCPVRAQCIPSEEFYLQDYTKLDDIYPSNYTKTCSACVSFLYTDDYQRIITGSGCYEDFEQLTKSTTAIPDEQKQFLKENQNDTYLIGDKYVLYSCNSEDDCAAGKSASLLNYNRINRNALGKLISKFDITFNETCEVPQPSKGIQTATGFGLTGIAILSIILLHF